VTTLNFGLISSSYQADHFKITNSSNNSKQLTRAQNAGKLNFSTLQDCPIDFTLFTITSKSPVLYFLSADQTHLRYRVDSKCRELHGQPDLISAKPEPLRSTLLPADPDHLTVESICNKPTQIGLDHNWHKISVNLLNT